MTKSFSFPWQIVERTPMDRSSSCEYWVLCRNLRSAFHNPHLRTQRLSISSIHGASRQPVWKYFTYEADRFNGDTPQKENWEWPDFFLFWRFLLLVFALRLSWGCVNYWMSAVSLVWVSAVSLDLGTFVFLFIPEVSLVLLICFYLFLFCLEVHWNWKHWEYLY